MINRNAVKVHVGQLRTQLARLTEEIDALDERSAQGLFYTRKLGNDEKPTEFGPRFSVCWSNRKEPHLEIDDEEVSPGQAMQIAVSAFWMVFESSRDMSDPSDRKTFEKHMIEFMERARRMCCQRREDRIAEMCTGVLTHESSSFCPVHDK